MRLRAALTSRRTWIRFAAVLLVAVCSIAGGAIALRTSSEGVYDTSVGRLEIDFRPAWQGQVELFVPIVDWELAADAYDAPVTVSIEARTVERTSAKNAIRNPNDVDDTVELFRDEARDVLREAARKAAIAASLGMLGGALVGGAIIALITLRRRWLIFALAEGAIVGLIVVGLTVVAVSRLDEARLNTPEIEGTNSTELPQLIAFSQQLLTVGDEYQAHYERALRSVSNALDFAQRGTTPAGPKSPQEHAIVLGSDLHNNVFVLDAFAKFAAADPVVLAGDFGQVGSRIEGRMAPKIAAVSDELYAVSGNHDSEQFMDALEDEGVTLLDDVELEINGLTVAGYRDPLVTPKDDDSHLLRVYGTEYEQQVDDFLEWFDELEEVPNIVVVHQRGLANKLLRHVEDKQLGKRLVILTGHDHKAHVEQLGPNVLIDGGTLGAGGPFAIGEQDASFVRVHFRGPLAYAADFVAIEPLSGEGVARRIVFEESTDEYVRTNVSSRKG